MADEKKKKKTTAGNQAGALETLPSPAPSPTPTPAPKKAAGPTAADVSAQAQRAAGVGTREAERARAEEEVQRAVVRERAQNIMPVSVGETVRRNYELGIADAGRVAELERQGLDVGEIARRLKLTPKKKK